MSKSGNFANFNIFRRKITSKVIWEGINMPILDSPLLAANFPKKFITLTLLCVQLPIIVSQNRNFRENFSSMKLVRF